MERTESPMIAPFTKFRQKALGTPERLDRDTTRDLLPPPGESDWPAAGEGDGR